MLKDRSWHAEGLCNGHPEPDLWHYDNSPKPEIKDEQVERSVKAIRICSDCPVKWDCLQQGIEPENLLWSIDGHGSIWGGRLTSERALMAGYAPSHNMILKEQRHAGNVKRSLGRIVR